MYIDLRGAKTGRVVKRMEDQIACFTCGKIFDSAGFYEKRRSCKGCAQLENKQGTKKRVRVLCDVPSVTEGDSHMYLFSYSDRPNLFKLGKSGDPVFRAAQLQMSQPFHVIVEHIWPHAGHLELQVHHAMGQYRHLTGNSHEHYVVERETIMHQAQIVLDIATSQRI